MANLGMRRALPLTAGAALVMVSTAASAVPTKGHPDAVVFHRTNAAAADVALGRERAAKGDCKGALDAFDRAVRVDPDPLLRRDRGLCHEKEGDIYPAVDDYRVYLTARPDDRGADQIRERLRVLQDQIAQQSPTTTRASTVAADVPAADIAVSGGTAPGAGESDVEDTLSVRIGGASRARAGASASGGADEGDDRRSLDVIEREERRVAEAAISPYRLGKGFVLGAFFGVRRWTRDSFAWAQDVGATLRYSFSRNGTFLAEVGYTAINSGDLATALGGATLFAGYELRIPLDTFVTNAIFVGAGAGYEAISQPTTSLRYDVGTVRARVGYRHVFGPALGLEFSIQGGPMFVHARDALEGEEADVVVAAVGAGAAVGVGF